MLLFLALKDRTALTRPKNGSSSFVQEKKKKGSSETKEAEEDRE